MNNDNSFEYTYSAREQEELLKIREKYLPRQESRLDQLRRLDSSVTKKATAAALSLGIPSSLVLGTGMSCCIVWGDALMLPGIAVGILGIAGMALSYPLYTRTIRKERARIAPEILRLTEEPHL
ncbi:MAG: hypothetical protein IJE81_07055 [Oscillospiraceae bacterium]|nr:hypothetical protein [Oscillospiraceae bacterium]